MAFFCPFPVMYRKGAKVLTDAHRLFFRCTSKEKQAFGASRRNSKCKKAVSAAPYIAGTIVRKPAPSYFQGAWAPHLIGWTAGKLPFRLQSRHGVQSGAAADCSLPAGHAQRSRGREHGERQGGGVRTRLLCSVPKKMTCGHPSGHFVKALYQFFEASSICFSCRF